VLFSAVALLFVTLTFSLSSIRLEAQSGAPAQSLLSGPARMAYLVPAQAPLYASIRIDRDYRAALNEVIAIVSSALPELGVPSGLRVEDALDLLTQELLNESFAQQEAWVGDYVAFTIQSVDVLFDGDRRNDAFVPGGLFVEVRNAASARAAAERALRNRNIAFTPQRLGSSTLYVPNNERDSFIVVVTNETLGVASRGYFDYLRAIDQRPQPTLRADQRFQNMLATLPESSYNALIYVDTAQFALAANATSRTPRLEGLATLQGTEPTLLGLTILPENILTIDAVQPNSMPTLFSALGVEIGEATPVTPAFVAYLPSNTLYALHGANLTQSYRDVTNALGALADTATLGILPNTLGERGLDLLAGLVTTIGFGLDFETDVLPALTGDYLVFVAPKTGTPPEPPPLEIPIDFGIVLANTDTGLASRVIERLYRAVPFTLQALGRPATFYRTEEGFSVVYDDGRFTFEVTVAQTADFVFIGTAGAYQGVLNAQRTFNVSRFATNAFPVLPDAAFNGYMSNAGLGSLRPSVAALLRINERDFETLGRLGRLFDVGVFSIKQVEDYVIVRLTVGLTPVSEQAALPPAPTNTPTATIDFVATISAELTATAAAQALRPSPTSTPVPPTFTPTPTIAVTPTFTPLPPLPTQPATGGLSTFVNNNSPRPFSITYPSAWGTQGLPPFATDGGVTYVGNTVSAWLPLFGSDLSTMEAGDISMSISVEDIGSSTTLGARVILGVLLGNITGGENATPQITTIAGRDSAFADLATGRRVVISIIDSTRIMLAFVYAPPGEMNAAFRTASDVLGSVTLVR
jgi:hypothetical protein